MAGNHSKNEVAAKMIGAQLQSLLKIPPINKADAQKGTGTAPEETRDSAKERGRYAEEKENSRNIPKIDRNVDTTVARDRFGRPFQSLDRRGRGRDFHNTTKRLPITNHQRDVPVGGGGGGGGSSSGLQEPSRSVAAVEASTSSGNHTNITAPKSRQNSQPQRHVAEPVHIAPTSSKAGNASAPTGPSNSFEERTSYKPFSAYEQPPRFSGGDDSSRIRVRDPVDPAVRQLARKPDCPWDVRENVDHFHDNDSKSWPNETASFALRRHGILCLHRKNPRFPRAKYYCECCNYHMDNLSATVNHIMQERHFCFEKMNKITSTLALIPQPSGDHSSYLTDLLIKTSKLHGMNITEKAQRMDIVVRLNEAIKENNLDCQAAIFGSSLSGFGFRDSNVNININVGNEPMSIAGENELPISPRALANNAEFSGITTKLLAVIKRLPHVSEHKVKEVYTPKCVSIHFEEEKSRTSCVVHFNNSSAVLAAQLFAEYDQMDARVKPLVLCFRHWARICDLDDQEKGFLPPHCYAIMVIHFLQRTFDPVLPILHLIPRVGDDLFATAEEAKRHWTTKNKQNVGELWLALLKYYSLEFDWKHRFISISRDNILIPKDEKQWNRRLCIEDPILPKSNLSRSVTNNKICDYIIDRIKIAYQYFGIPRKESGPLYDGALMATHASAKEIYRVAIETTKPTTSQALQRMVRQIQKANNPLDDKEDLLLTANQRDQDWSGANDCPANEVQMVKVCWRQKTLNLVYGEDTKKFRDVLFKKQYQYEFKEDNLTDGSLPPVICKSCGAEGHLRHSCPDETVPLYLPVDYPTPLTLNRLNSAIAINFDREALDNRDVSIRTRIVDEVKAILTPVFPSICLTLFGSTFNGFGMHSSDVDICLTFNDILVPPTERGIRMIDVNDVLEKVVNSLKASGKMVEVLSIPSAKVPIVKFRHVACKLDGDISLYNRLSIFNTELLRIYVDLDSRVARLGLFLKKLVKVCDVGDASKGSLSSYSYILMLIHFLQNHSIPVLPVLQEVPSMDPTVRKFYCDGHLIDYPKDVKAIASCWDGYGRNKESVSQLWLAFLNYYVEKFDHEKYIISISQSAPLTRATKCWYTEGIAIEDPFDKSHNLGSGLTRRMSVHILKTLQKCRIFFHRSTDHLRNDVNFMEYYLDVRQVRDGNPPIDRQCRLCYRIGHYARNCTYVNKREDDEAQQEGLPFTKKDDAPTLNGTIQQRVMDRLPPNFVVREESPVIVETPVKPLQSIKSPWSENPNPAPAVDNVIRKPEVIGPPKIQNDATALITHSLNALILRSREMEEAAKQNEANKPVKEVVFFGDIGSPNADGEQIKAMLQKNEGVTFTFDLAQQQQMEGMNANTPEINAPNNIGIRQPPPGFCPPGNMYMRAHTVPTGHGMPYLPEEATSRPVIPTPPGQPQPYPIIPIAQHPPPYGHNTPPFQPLMQPVAAVTPFENRPQLVNGENVEMQPQPIGVTTAPPPGFAPLPTANNNIASQPTEMLRSYPASPFPTGHVPASMYSMAPVGGIGYPHLPNNNSYTSGASSGVAATVAGGGMPGPMQGLNIIHHQQMGQHMVSNFQPHMIPLNAGIPNGQPMENGGDMVDSPVGEVSFNVDYGGHPGAGVMPGGSTPVSSYGLSLSQSHHGPVVSALQMQHSLQMQGGHGHGHFHHHIRPIMAIGSYHHGSAYTMHPPMHPTHGLGHDNMVPINADSAMMNQNAVEIKQMK